MERPRNRHITMQTTAVARLRKTFQYPTDDYSSSQDNNNPAADAMDEQEQEILIATLSAQNQQRNEQFRKLLVLIPAIAAIPYLVFLLLAPPPKDHDVSSSATVSLLSLLSLSSLGSTAFLVWRLGPTRTGVGAVDRWTGAGVEEEGESASPLEAYLPYLNVLLAVLAFLTGYLGQRGLEGGRGMMSGVWLGSLPGVVYAVVVVAKVMMAGVDPERELSELRYEFKGA